MGQELFQDPRRPYPQGRGLVVQIQAPLPARVPLGHFDEQGRAIVDKVASREEYLALIQAACRYHGDQLTIRFYAHYGEECFDAAILHGLNEIRSLAIEVYCPLANPEAIGRLPNLAELSFSPRGKTPPDLLASFNVQRLEHLTLGETASPMLDLSPIGEAGSLQTLRLLSRGKNSEAIGACQSLRELAIVPSNLIDLAFIGRLQSLEVLKFVLGKIESVDAIPNLPRLRDLSFKEVHSFTGLGDLERFPELQRLQLEDQKRVESLTVGSANTALKHIRLYSVPSLKHIHGLKALPRLKSLWAYDCGFEPDWASLPKSLTHFQLVSKSMKGRGEHDEMVRAHGLIPELHPDASFFYK